VTAPPDVCRPQPAYARSVAYVMQAGVLPMPADALLFQYGHIHLVELFLQGVPPSRANGAGYLLVHQSMAPLTGTPPGQPPRAATVKCVAERVSLAGGMVSEILGRPILGRPAPPPPRSLRPWADMLSADMETMLWLSEAVRRHELGTPLLEAARGAHDQHLGKPRQRRQPVERSWLADQVQAVLTVAWWALLHARFQGKLWLLPDRLEAAGLDEDHRPVCTADQLEGGDAAWH